MKAYILEEENLLYIKLWHNFQFNLFDKKNYFLLDSDATKWHEQDVM